MADEIAALIQLLSTGDAAARAAAAERLARLGEAAQLAAVALVKALADADEPLLDWVTAALEGLGPPRTSDLAELASLAAHQHLDTAYWAVTLLGRAGAAAIAHRDAIAGVARQHPEVAVRRRAEWALAKLGE
jgi:HEAT repeat protein